MAKRTRRSVSTRPTLADIADRVGVSPAAVSYALTNREGHLVAKDTKDRIRSVAREMGYLPNTIARSLRKQSTDFFGLIFPTFLNDWVTRMVAALNDAVNQQGRQLLIESVKKRSEESQVRSLARLAERMVDGVFVFWPHAPWLVRQDDVPGYLPVVTIDAYMGLDVPAGSTAVVVDRASGIYDAVSFLLSQGRRRVAMVLPPVGGERVPGPGETASRGRLRVAWVSSEAQGEKVAGWREAYRRAGVPADPGLLLRMPHHGEWDVQPGLDLAKDLLDAQLDIDGILLGSDFAAVGVIKGLLSAGVRVPDDIAVVGFDNAPVCEASPVRLASIDFPVEEMAGHAVRLMLERTAGPEREGAVVTLPMRFIRRESSG